MVLAFTTTITQNLKYNWASEASPTLGCSIEILRDIYVSVSRSVGQYVCRVQKCVGRIMWPKHAHAQSQIWAVKTDLCYSFRLNAGAVLARTKEKRSPRNAKLKVPV